MKYDTFKIWKYLREIFVWDSINMLLDIAKLFQPAKLKVALFYKWAGNNRSSFKKRRSLAVDLGHEISSLWIWNPLHRTRPLPLLFNFHKPTQQFQFVSFTLITCCLNRLVEHGTDLLSSLSLSLSLSHTHTHTQPKPHRTHCLSSGLILAIFLYILPKIYSQHNSIFLYFSRFASDYVWNILSYFDMYFTFLFLLIVMFFFIYLSMLKCLISD